MLAPHQSATESSTSDLRECAGKLESCTSHLILCNSQRIEGGLATAAGNLSVSVSKVSAHDGPSCRKVNIHRYFEAIDIYTLYQRNTFVFSNFITVRTHKALDHIRFLQIHMDCSSWCREILNVSFYLSNQLTCSDTWRSVCQVIKTLSALQCLTLVLHESWIGGTYAVMRMLEPLKDLCLEDKLKLRLNLTVNISDINAVLKEEGFDCYM